MWQLQSEEKDKRTYTNSATGSKCTTSKVYTDRDGNDWYEFSDLLTIPFTRSFAAAKITSLYGVGLSKDDITSHVSGLKSILNSDDKEIKQKAYALVLDFEEKANAATDIVKQLSSLVPVYFTINDEPIDAIDNSLMIKKLSMMEADIELHSFFLIRLKDATERYMSFLNQISQTALPILPKSAVLSE